MSSTIKTTTLENGVRVITDSVSSVESAALGIWIGAGARDEDLSRNGAAHMVEHMLFKGTNKRDAAQIVWEIEDAGGAVNAYTSREMTSYHIHLLKDDVGMGLDVLADMAGHSIFPQEEIERERGVILQEIGMCHDTPDDLVFDLYFEAAYPEQAFGAPILGRAPIIEAMSRADLTGFVERFYNPARMVVSAAGNLEHEALVEQVRRVLQPPARDESVKQAPKAGYRGGEIRLERDLEQAHFILGFEGFSRLDEDYYAVQALSTLLGSGMSSRLFQEVREKRGLVYSIFSFHSGFQDTGQFGVYAGTGPDQLDEVVPVICEELMKVRHDVREDELSRAKAQLKAHLLMRRESMMSRADRQARHALFREGLYDPAAMVAQIEAVNLKAIERVAARLLSSKPTLAALGPLAKLEDYGAVEGRLAA